MLRPTPPLSAPTLGVVFLACLLTAAVGGPTAAPQPGTQPAPNLAAPATDSLTATVRYVREHGIDVITGVQVALSLTYIALDSSTVIRKEGAPVTLANLKPGDLVTIEYRETPRGKVARSIVVEPPVRREDAR